MSTPLFNYINMRWFTETAEKHEMEEMAVRFDGIGHMVASVSFGPTGGKMVLGPKKDEMRCIDCKPVDDYSDWDTFCLVQLDEMIGGPRLIVVRQQYLVGATVN
jgi:hypothetical protein